MARLFISYNRREADYAFAIRQWLMDEQGWNSEDIFVDASHLHAGVEWEPKLLAEAEAAEVMLFLASDHSLHIRSFCYRELKHARGEIIAVTIKGVPFNDERLATALSYEAKGRQVVALDKKPTAPFSFTSPVDGSTGTIDLNPECVAGIGLSLREIGVAPNSYTWTPKEEGPFPGLRPLMEGDEAVFCGRDFEIRDGLKAIEDLRTTVTQRALIIQAPSGAGKSSFLRAGLWRRLRRNPGFTPLAIIRAQGGAIRHEEWGLAAGLFDSLKPDRSDLGGKLPLSQHEIATQASENLVGLLTDFADADRSEETGRRTLLLGIDQAEEITNLSPEDEAELSDLLEAVFHLPADLDLRLVLTARDDSVDATRKRLIAAGLEPEQVETWRLHRLDQSKFDDIITGPAGAANLAGWPLEIDDALVNALAYAAGSGMDEEGGDALPILALALQRMVAKRRAPDGRITLEPEQAADFVERAVADATGEALRSAGADAEDLRKLVIPRLATWDPRAGAEGAAKRQVTTAADLFTGERAGLKPLADALVDQRLFTRSHGDAGTAYEVAHEALLRVPPLGALIFDCREKFEQARILEVEAREWVDSGKAAANLARTGGRLDDAFALLEDPDFGIDLREKDVQGATVGEYLGACRDHEEAEKKRRDRNRRRVIAGLSATTLVAVALAVAAFWMTEQALRSRDAANAKDAEGALAKAELAKMDGNVYPDQILHRARAIGFAGFPSGERDRSGLGEALQTRLDLLLGREEDFPVLLSSRPDRLKEVQDQLTGETPAYLPFWRTEKGSGEVSAISVSEDGDRVAATFADGSIRQWDLSGESVTSLTPTEQMTAREDEKPGLPIELTADGVRVAVVGEEILLRHPSRPTAAAIDWIRSKLYVGMEDGTVMGWNLSSRKIEPGRDLKVFVGDELEWTGFSENASEVTMNPEGKAGFIPNGKSRESSEVFDGKIPEPFSGLVNGIGMELIYLPPGQFWMGSPEGEAGRGDDEVHHEVKLTEGFWMGKYEVTQREWIAITGGNPSSFPGLYAPVESVIWFDVMGRDEEKGFCEKLTERERKAKRIPADWEYTLPTEAQWEYACRAGTKTPFFWGATLNGDRANCDGNYPYPDGTATGPNVGRTTPVGRYEPNPWGLYDMHGNVYEWCLDWYGDYEVGENGGPIADPSGPASGVNRVYRGGSWYGLARGCRSAYRDRGNPEDGIYGLGFRVALVPIPDGERKERTTGAAAEARNEPAAAEGGSGVSGF